MKKPRIVLMVCVVIAIMLTFSVTAYATTTPPPESEVTEDTDTSTSDETASEPESQEAGRPEPVTPNINDDDLANVDWSGFFNSFPLSVTGEKFDGSGTLVDYVTTGTKHFYTIVSREGNVFYLVIDYDKEQDNVYFLTEIDQAAMLDADQRQAYERGQITASVQQPQQTEQTPVQVEEPVKSAGKPPTMLIMAAVVFLAVGGIGYYVKILKPKQQKKNAAKVMADGQAAMLQGDPEEEFSDDDDMFDLDYEDED